MKNHFTDKKFWSLEEVPELERQRPGPLLTSVDE